MRVLLCATMLAAVSSVNVTFDDQTYEACPNATVRVEWKGNHTLQESTSSSCNSSDYTGTLIKESQSAGYVEKFNNMFAEEGQTRYFVCTLENHCENGKKFAITCPEKEEDIMVAQILGTIAGVSFIVYEIWHKKTYGHFYWPCSTKDQGQTTPVFDGSGPVAGSTELQLRV